MLLSVENVKKKIKKKKEKKEEKKKLSLEVQDKNVPEAINTIGE